MKKINVICIEPEDNTGVKKIHEKIKRINFRTGELIDEETYRWADEELDCEFFVSAYGSKGCINYCKGNEPYCCHRAKKEKLCHKVMVKVK